MIGKSPFNYATILLVSNPSQWYCRMGSLADTRYHSRDDCLLFHLHRGNAAAIRLMTRVRETPDFQRLRFRNWIVDGFIAIVLLVFAVDTMPCTPEPVRRLMRPLLSPTGLWQGTWSLFAPIPDSRNHRLRADIEFTDGSHHVWDSPDWRSQSAWQRFVGHRESECLEKIWEDDNTAAWPAFAELLVRRELALKQSTQAPRQVVLSVRWGDIPPPEGDWWSATIPRAYDQERVFFTLIYAE